MYIFSHIEGDLAVFIGDTFGGEIRLTRKKIEEEIDTASRRVPEAARRKRPEEGTCLDSVIRRFWELRAAQEAFEKRDLTSQTPSMPKAGKTSASPAAAPAFAQTAAPSGEGKTAYQFAGIGNGSMEAYLFKKGVCIRSGDPSVFEALLSECPSNEVGAVRAAAKAARMVQELMGKDKDPLRSGKFKKFLVFQGIDNGGRKPKAVFAFYNGRTGENEPPFQRTLPELKHSTADAADYGEYEAAIKALEEVLGKGNALPAPAVPEREAQPSAGLSKGYRMFDFQGCANHFERIRLLETSDKGERVHDSSDPSVFEALLRECHPNLIGPVRAAMKVAELVQHAREIGENLEDIMPPTVKVFAGIDRGFSGPPSARLQKYEVRFGKKVGEPVHGCLAELQSRDGLLGLEESETQAAIDALEALGNENAPSISVAEVAAPSGARRPFSRSAGAEGAPTATVRCTGVVTELRKGQPHAEAGFRRAGVFAGTSRTGVSGKTYLTAEQIGKKIAELAEGHPDRAVYETALHQVREKNRDLCSAPVRAGEEMAYPLR